MTLPTLTFKVKPTDNGEFQIEVSPNQFKEPVVVPWNPPGMPGSRRRNQHREDSKKVFAL
jgi:hypothetical protein